MTGTTTPASELGTVTAAIGQSVTPMPSGTATAMPGGQGSGGGAGAPTPTPTPAASPTPTPTLTAPAPQTPTNTPEGAPTATQIVAQPATGTTPDQLTLGQSIYTQTCAFCHGVNGEGLPGTFPALAGDPVVLSSYASPAINQVLHGGERMPPFKDQLSDSEIAAVISYVRRAWNNDASVVTEGVVARVRD